MGVTKRSSVFKRLASTGVGCPAFTRQKQATCALEDQGSSGLGIEGVQGSTLSRAFSSSLTGMLVQVRCIMVSTHTCMRALIQPGDPYDLTQLMLGLQGLS